MSRILRRPMFRGGRVDGRGTGITSGLGYEKGGRVGYRNAGSVMSRGGLGGSNRNIGSGKGLTKGTRTSRLATQLRSLFPLINQGIRGIGFNPATGYAAATVGAPVGLAYLNRAKTDKGLQFMKDTDPSVFDETAMPTIGNELGEMEAYSEGLRKANEQGNEISFLDNFFLDPETGTYPAFLGRTQDRDKLAALAAEKEAEISDLNEIDTTGNVADVREGETPFDAVMRQALETNKRKENVEDIKTKLLEKSGEGEEQIDIDKKLFEKVYGGGKGAMIQDASDMAISFAKNALKDDATVKSAFAGFLEDESKRPSKRQAIKDNAATLAINKYIKGEISKAELDKLLAVTQFKSDLLEGRSKGNVAEYIMNSKASTFSGRVKEGVQAKLGPQKFEVVKSEIMQDPTKFKAGPEDIGTIFIEDDTKKVYTFDSDLNEVLIYQG
jgi:hypothetical protein